MIGGEEDAQRRGGNNTRDDLTGILFSYARPVVPLRSAACEEDRFRVSA